MTPSITSRNSVVSQAGSLSSLNSHDFDSTPVKPLSSDELELLCEISQERGLPLPKQVLGPIVELLLLGVASENIVDMFKLMKKKKYEQALGKSKTVGEGN